MHATRSQLWRIWPTAELLRRVVDDNVWDLSQDERNDPRTRVVSPVLVRRPFGRSGAYPYWIARAIGRRPAYRAETQAASSVTHSEMSEEQKFPRLAHSRKQLMDAVKMIVYRAETALVSIVRE